MKKYSAMLLVLSLILLVLSGCAPAAESGGQAERIVVLSAADCEIIYALGAGDLVVGRGEYCDWPEQVKEVPAVQSGSETNIEQIIALEPQLVFMSALAQSPEQATLLENAGIRVVQSYAVDIAGVYTSIETIGRELGREKQAAELVGSMKKSFEDIANTIPESGDSPAKTVYFEVSPLEYGLWTAGSGTFMDEIAQMTGLRNIFDDVEDWAEISQEQVIERNPDYIVTITMFFGDGPPPEEEIRSRDGWQDISAIKSGNVFIMNYDELSRPGPRLVDAAQSLRDLVWGAA